LAKKKGGISLGKSSANSSELQIHCGRDDAHLESQRPTTTYKPQYKVVFYEIQMEEEGWGLLYQEEEVRRNRKEGLVADL